MLASMTSVFTAPHVLHEAELPRVSVFDGRVQGSDAVFEAKFMLPWSFSGEAAAEKYMAHQQHNMWVVAAGTAVRSFRVAGVRLGSRGHRLDLR